MCHVGAPFGVTKSKEQLAGKNNKAKRKHGKTLGMEGCTSVAKVRSFTDIQLPRTTKRRRKLG